MVKKKRQHDAHEDDSSTDSCEEKELYSPSAAVNSCQHVKKSVDATRLRKQLKFTGLVLECSLCSKLGSGNCTTDEAGFEYDNTLWLCLKCGTQLCGRSKNQHAMQHFKTPHSDSHSLTMNTRSFEIWCYECDNEVSSHSRKNLLECVELVKKLAQKPPATISSKAAATPSNGTAPISVSAAVTAAAAAVVADTMLNNIEDKIIATWEAIRPLVPTTGGSANTVNIDKPLPLLPPPPPPPTLIPGMAKRINDSTIDIANSYAVNNKNASTFDRSIIADLQIVDRLPRVRGLTNLGNTCFFNAVMQCLAQTPYLLDVLKELSEPGEEFTLPGGTFKLKDQEDIELPMIKGTLSSWGGLTAVLAHALEELQSGGGVFTPSKLFDKLCNKCPQFTGGDQHDSHELLRQLLESVRSEDLKRYQRVILQNLGYKDQDISSVSEEMRQKCKIYGNQAADRILRPEQVFRGFLVSTLTCQDCYNVSSRHEYFLDMSLPVSVEKPQPPQRRKPSPDNSPTGVAPNAITADNTSFYLHSTPEVSAGSTKSQIKKEAVKERKAKRAAKHQRNKQAQKLAIEVNGHSGDGGGGDADTSASEGTTANENVAVCATREEMFSSSVSSSEQSDADVEDNLVEETNTTQNNNRLTHYYMDTNGNNQPLPEKHDDIPEHMDKDSLEEDENDSGIATSPSHTNGINKDVASGVNSVLAVGLSEKGASLVRQLSLGESVVTNTTTHEAETSLVKGVSKETSSMATSFTINSQMTIEESRTLKIPQTNGESNLILQLDQLKLQEQQHRMRSKRVRTQSYSDWSTTIAPRYQCDDGECSVQSCLNNFTAVELMTGNNKVGCDSCTKRINGDNPKAKTVNTNATKQFLISSPPAVLILHLKRFQLGPRCIFRKLTRAVSFPMMLDIAPFCGSKVKNLPNIDRKQKKLVYALYGIVEHSGGMYGGHYTAYVKVRPKLMPDDKRWKFIPHGSKAELDQDDEQVKKLEELLAKEKARELRAKAVNDSDDFTSSTSSASEPEEYNQQELTSVDGQTSAAGNAGEATGDNSGKEEADNVEAPVGKWFYVSDSRVQEVKEETVLKAQAYLLFYERIY